MKKKTGLVKTLSVMPGDVVTLKVYAKYIDTNSSNWSTALNNLVAAIAGTQSGTVIDGGGYSTNTSRPFPYTGWNGTGENTGSGPKAYLNYIMFDRDFNPIIEDHSQTGFERVNETAKEDGQTNPADPANGVAHQLLEATITAKQAGYLYIYLSNEEASPVEVFFDDFEVEHTKSPVVQSEEYYPFGAVFNSYSRENSILQSRLYQQKELQRDLSLSLYDFEWRQYDPFAVRTTTMDLQADSYAILSPYSWAANNPISVVIQMGKRLSMVFWVLRILKMMRNAYLGSFRHGNLTGKVLTHHKASFLKTEAVADEGAVPRHRR